VSLKEVKLIFVAPHQEEGPDLKEIRKEKKRSSFNKSSRFILGLPIPKKQDLNLKRGISLKTLKNLEDESLNGKGQGGVHELDQGQFHK